ncbi:MAG: hypothetical protein M1833_000764 [Piccolia ochrophora]|nr:MAG: hypothetical protein M1833_000764 [Piccolia ochrophora]
MYWPLGAPRIYAVDPSLGPHNSIGADGDQAAIGSSDLLPEKLQGQNVSSDETAATDSDTGLSATLGRDAPRSQDSQPTESHIKATNAARIDAASESIDAQGTDAIVGLRVSRSGQLFSTFTSNAVTIWHTRPTAVLARVIRSSHSLEAYGINTSLLLRPDSAVLVVQTALGYLITYSLATNVSNPVYQPSFPQSAGGHSRRHSVGNARALWGGNGFLSGSGEGRGFRELAIRFRMVIKIDAGVSKALALDNELIVATEKPAAVQCIRWTPDANGSQTSTELLSRMAWMPRKTCVTNMVHDRAMNLATWITADGRGFAVQRTSPSTPDDATSRQLFRGYCFHNPANDKDVAVKAAINARFSLIAVGCEDGSVSVYVARDYVGNIPLSHRLQPSVSFSSSGKITFMSYSPDGYCLFVGFQKGWMMWSVFGKPGGSSFVTDRNSAHANNEQWLLGVRDGAWVSGGSEIMLVGQNDDRIFIMGMARSAVSGCFSASNVSQSLLQTDSGIMIYRGNESSGIDSISGEANLWQPVPAPASYLLNQWPLRAAVISPDGRYVAVAGRRGLAHYSVNSGRWKTFLDDHMENEFAVRGGMCWHQHILIAAIESNGNYGLRLFSRELALDNSLSLHTETLAAPVVLISRSGEDSLLVYTQDNILYHYVITATNTSVALVQVGQIGFHGIVRSPARVRALSWILPDEQIRNGDPAQDVTVAAVLFLVDGKLVVLQPSITEENGLKYEMRVLAHSVEYFGLMRDRYPFATPPTDDSPLSNVPMSASTDGEGQFRGLADSLWIFDGQSIRTWPDVQELLGSAPGEQLHAVTIHVDFYPLSIMSERGVLLGLDPELVQRRDLSFAFYKFVIRTQLFLPAVFRHYLSQYDLPAALSLSHQYTHLPYFPHALEILLHDVLDEEVDRAPSKEDALLPTVISFLSNFPDYLDIIVQCTRKTEVRSWRTLFEHLPSPQELFDEALNKGWLKTAGGYLLVLQTFQELGSSSPQVVQLLSEAKEEEDWELCKELARFLMALDETGATLREALQKVDLSGEWEMQRDSGSSALPLPSYANGTELGLGIVSRSRPQSASGKLSEAMSPEEVNGNGEGEQEYFNHGTPQRNVLPVNETLDPLYKRVDSAIRFIGSGPPRKVIVITDQPLETLEQEQSTGYWYMQVHMALEVAGTNNPDGTPKDGRARLEIAIRHPPMGDPFFLVRFLDLAPANNHQAPGPEGHQGSVRRIDYIGETRATNKDFVDPNKGSGIVADSWSKDMIYSVGPTQEPNTCNHLIQRVLTRLGLAFPPKLQAVFDNANEYTKRFSKDFVMGVWTLSHDIASPDFGGVRSEPWIREYSIIDPEFPELKYTNLVLDRDDLYIEW